MSSPNAQPQTATSAQTTANAQVADATQAQDDEGFSEDDVVQADDSFSDSGFGTNNSDTTSISSSIYAGYVENGRRYQTVREGEYWGPSDDKQFESMQQCHILHQILDSKAKNPLFYSPIPATAQNILDVGTGGGIWAIDVADHFPSTLVTGVDLYPPPNTWISPNCKLEVDDVLKPWTWAVSFDLIHIRYLMGSFTDKQWSGIYKEAYENLIPGGWIEQLEPDVKVYCDDGTLPEDALWRGWGDMFIKLGAKTGRRLDNQATMRSQIEAAGFINVHEKSQKCPMGEWAKNPVLKEAGRFQKMQFLSGMEGYAMFLLTKFGEPEPWTPEQVQVYLAKVRQELNNSGYHSYIKFRRVWAQKPLDTKEAAAKPNVEVETVA